MSYLQIVEGETDLVVRILILGWLLAPGQEGWEGVKSGFVPNVVHSSEEVVKSERRCLC